MTLHSGMTISDAMNVIWESRYLQYIDFIPLEKMPAILTARDCVFIEMLCLGVWKAAIPEHKWHLAHSSRENRHGKEGRCLCKCLCLGPLYLLSFVYLFFKGKTHYKTTLNCVQMTILTQDITSGKLKYFMVEQSNSTNVKRKLSSSASILPSPNLIICNYTITRWPFSFRSQITTAFRS